MGFTVGVQDYSSQMGYYIDSYCDSCSHAKEHLELSAEKPDDNIGPLIVTYTIFGGVLYCSSSIMGPKTLLEVC